MMQNKLINHETDKGKKYENRKRLIGARSF